MSITALERPNLTHTLCFLFSGKAGVGKTYCSDILLELLKNSGLKSAKFPFAYGVKATATFMGWDGKKDLRGRRLLQVIGQGGRAYNPNLWVHSTFVRIEESVGYPYDAVLIDDWRFINEYEYIMREQLLYKPVRIRVLAPEREILKGTPEYDEISEKNLDWFEFDHTIENTSDGPDHVRDLLKRIIHNYIAVKS